MVLADASLVPYLWHDYCMRVCVGNITSISGMVIAWISAGIFIAGVLSGTFIAVCKTLAI